MSLYFELLQKPIFSVEDLAGRYEKISGARSAIKSLVRQGMAVKIRNNMYTCISGETGNPVANRFQIASSITSTSYVTHHSALEYYGITDQVFHEVYVASLKPFSEFDFDGFFSYRDAAKFISKERAELYEYNPVTYGKRDSGKSYFLLHTEKAEKMADNLVKAAEKYNAGASFQDLGEDLSSDFYRKKTYSRQEVMKRQTQKMKEYVDKKVPIMVNMGNDYAIPFSTMVTNMDLRGSEYTILDEAVPFFQLAVHGRVNYTGKPINISGNVENEVLYSAEYGAGLYFTLMDETSFATQKTL